MRMYIHVPGQGRVGNRVCIVGKIITGLFEPGSINSLVLGDGKPPTFNDGNPYFMGPYKPLRDWVDEFIPYYIYMEIMGV